MSTFHEEATTMDWAPLQVNVKEYDANYYLGLAYVVRYSDAHVRFMAQNGFDFIGRKDFVCMNFHIKPLEVLTFRPYQEAARRDVDTRQQNVPLQWNFKMGQLKVNNTKCSLCMRHGEDETSLALHAGALHTFKQGEP